MAQAYQCDRCGKFILKIDPIKNFTTSEKFEIVTEWRRKSDFEFQDLCIDCQIELLKECISILEKESNEKKEI